MIETKDYRAALVVIVHVTLSDGSFEKVSAISVRFGVRWLDRVDTTIDGAA